MRTFFFEFLEIAFYSCRRRVNLLVCNKNKSEDDRDIFRFLPVEGNLRVSSVNPHNDMNTKTSPSFQI